MLWHLETQHNLYIPQNKSSVNADEVAKKKKISLKKLPIVANVIEYNEIDVKVLQEILEFIRSTQMPKSLKRVYDGPSMYTRSVKRKLL